MIVAKIGRPVASSPSTLSITTFPSGVTVLIDGKQAGRTPANVPVVAGQHRVTLQRPDPMEQTSVVRIGSDQTVRLSATLWDRNAKVIKIRPPFPGGVISDATFLGDGRLTLDVTLPPGVDHQLWVRARDGGLERAGPATAIGPVAVTRDGRTVAYLMPMAATSASSDLTDASQGLNAVWTVGADGRGATLTYALPPNARSMRLADVAWVPDRRHLVLVGARQDTVGNVSNELLWLDLKVGSAQSVLDLSARSSAWRPSCSCSSCRGS